MHYRLYTKYNGKKKIIRVFLINYINRLITLKSHTRAFYFLCGVLKFQNISIIYFL